jgi:hypothetical protein
MITVHPPIWHTTPAGELHYAALVRGLPESFYEADGGGVYIDYFIMPLIVGLNELGYETDFSCSGLKVEHTDPYCAGYVSFVGYNPPPDVPKSFYNDGGVIRTHDARRLGLNAISEYAKVTRWIEWMDVVKARLGKGVAA